MRRCSKLRRTFLDEGARTFGEFGRGEALVVGALRSRGFGVHAVAEHRDDGFRGAHRVRRIGGDVASEGERARREALCRMLEDAQRLGATAVINVRYETANIGGMGPNSMPMAEVVAYGTAVFVAR